MSIEPSEGLGGGRTRSGFEEIKRLPPPPGMDDPERIVGMPRPESRELTGLPRNRGPGSPGSLDRKRVLLPGRLGRL